MSSRTIRTIEHDFDFHVTRILQRLHEQYVNEEATEPFEEWLWQNRSEVGEEFLGDVETWAGLADSISEMLADTE